MKIKGIPAAPVYPKQLAYEGPKLDVNSPEWKTMQKLVETLTPFSRREQLKILVAVCAAIDQPDHAQRFLDALKAERSS